ncbi:RNA methyltransferase [Cupriavidus gilardii]|uniref:RNA methyltransferase n=1 Tax=Cupriavidus gilardii TaxID=82541 RepID=UPI001ABDA854|nr:RNA methyltransferase [Cupriavidus gilardii]MBO4120152.1 RNA methyltransferase [Cupriavidus gilardii]
MDTSEHANEAPAAQQAAVEAAFARVRFVLVETSHPGNVGSVARAIKTMGFGAQPGALVLVSPREPAVREHPEAVALASGADDVLRAARVVDDLETALAGASYTVAMTARQREFGPPRLLPREATARAGQYLLAAAAPAAEAPAAMTDIAFVFGNERYGLPNEAVDRCSVVTHIPANPAYASLNLAQAVQLIAYEMRLALLQDRAAPPSDIGYAGQAATAEQIEAMFGHLQQGLEAIGFLDPAHPKKLMPRLRRLFARSGLEQEEVNLLRGIAKQMTLAGRGPRGGDRSRDGGCDRSGDTTEA